MIKDLEMQRCLDHMSGIGVRVTGEVVHDYKLLYELKRELQKRSARNLIKVQKAGLGLTYLLLFHPSPLVRHEAAFIIGEYGREHNTFLRSSAYLDPDATVRHEAALAMSARSQRGFYSRNRWILEYITTHDRNRMVRDTARVSLDTIDSYGK